VALEPKDRYFVDRKLGCRGHKMFNARDPAYQDEMAGEAERFFAQRFELPEPDNLPDRGWDFKIGGVTIDVKWTDYNDGRLLLKCDSRSRADVYVLVVGKTPQAFRIVGYAYAAKLKASQKDLGHGPVYALDQAQLNPSVRKLIDTLRKLYPDATASNPTQ